MVQSPSGICPLDEPTAITLLGGRLKSWSVGPLAVIILSSGLPKITWPVEELFFIAENPRGRLHRVKGFLVQLGDMSVRRKSGPQLTMQKPCGVEVILQASKKYVAPEMWSKLWESPVRALIELLFPDGAKPESCFSRRWLPKARFDATVFQTTCSLDAAVFATLRKTCSQRGIFAQRKREEVPHEFIAWLPVDVSYSEARAQQQQHDSQVNGLICVKDRLGLSTSQSSLPALLKARLSATKVVIMVLRSWHLCRVFFLVKKATGGMRKMMMMMMTARQGFRDLLLALLVLGPLLTAVSFRLLHSVLFLMRAIGSTTPTMVVEAPQVDLQESAFGAFGFGVDSASATASTALRSLGMVFGGDGCDSTSPAWRRGCQNEGDDDDDEAWLYEARRPRNVLQEFKAIVAQGTRRLGNRRAFDKQSSDHLGVWDWVSGTGASCAWRGHYLPLYLRMGRWLLVG